MRIRTPVHQQQKMFFYISTEKRIQSDHPRRPVKAMDHTFSKMYSSIGRPSIPPERLLKALLLQLLYSIRSERSLIEHIDYNLLFRWFIGMHVDEPVWEHSTFSKNRDRQIDADVAISFLELILKRAKEEKLLSKDHFSMDVSWFTVKWNVRPLKKTAVPALA